VIDLHCHILPGLDDGAATIEDSLAMARAAVATGITTVVGTPHIRDDHPFGLDQITVRARQLSEALAEERIELGIVEGAEVAVSKIPELLEAGSLPQLCLGSGKYILIESPYTPAGDPFEEILFTVQLAGFRPVLAHPERCPSFLTDESRLASLVERGVLCSVTAASMMGQFGDPVRKFTLQLFRAGLVHDVASDAHDHVNRPIDLRAGFESIEHELPGALEQISWFTDTTPAAIIAGDELPPPPGRLQRRGRRLQRLFGS
jgi:protein-tyrosine phosphatase